MNIHTWLLPALAAVAVWWLSTVVLMFIVRHRVLGRPATLVLASALLIGGLVALVLTRDDHGLASTYVAFLGTIAIWAAQEVTFLTGWITGPRRTPSLARPGSGRHFRDALAALLHHELLLLTLAGLVALICADRVNETGWWTFLVLWIMRISAKLNLYLGVRFSGQDWLPQHLDHLKGYFTRRSMNLLFPLSVTAGTIAASALIVRVSSEPFAPGVVAGHVLVATLLGLAVIEHWFMVLPWHGEALWKLATESGNRPLAPNGLSGESR